jgi:hypothetical protein
MIVACSKAPSNNSWEMPITLLAFEGFEDPMGGILDGVFDAAAELVGTDVGGEVPVAGVDGVATAELELDCASPTHGAC